MAYWANQVTHKELTLLIAGEQQRMKKHMNIPGSSVEAKSSKMLQITENSIILLFSNATANVSSFSAEVKCSVSYVKVWETEQTL